MGTGPWQLVNWSAALCDLLLRCGVKFFHPRMLVIPRFADD